MESQYVRAQYAETANREIDGELVIERPDNSDGGTAVVAFVVQNFDTGDRLITLQFDRDQVDWIVKTLQAV